MKEYRKEDWISPKVEIRPSPLHGRGMFAIVPIKKDEVVAVWGGNFVNGAGAAKARLAGRAIQQIEDDVFEVFDYEKRGEGGAYYHNHSCNPNTWMKDEVTITARHDIEPGDELTFDYALFEADEDHVAVAECRCGTPGCRKRITGKDWRLPELQERYVGHFSPMIGRRIAEGRLRRVP